MAQNNITNPFAGTNPYTGATHQPWVTNGTKLYYTGDTRISPYTGSQEVFDGIQWTPVSNPAATHALTQYKLTQVLAWLDENHPEIIFDLLMRDTICQTDLPKGARDAMNSKTK